MKLELKHIAPYLPYGVQIEVTDYCIELGSYEQKKETYITTLDAYGLHYFNTNVRLILRPLSDLNNIIKHNGIEINLFDKIEIYKGSGIDYLIEQIRLGLVEVIIFNLLLEHHFDVFGLIEQGLAININTL